MDNRDNSTGHKLADSTMYKCKKAITLTNYKQAVCKWKGTLDEYIQHVKIDHAESYFLVQKQHEKFQWKLPFLGDQTDLGIFEHQAGHFLYEIYYKEDAGKLYFSLAYVGEFATGSPRYKLLLCNENGMESSECLVNVKPNEISKPIQEQEYIITINKNVLLNYTDQSRIFQWYVVITDCKDTLRCNTLVQ